VRGIVGDGGEVDRLIGRDSNCDWQQLDTLDGRVLIGGTLQLTGNDARSRHQRHGVDCGQPARQLECERHTAPSRRRNAMGRQWLDPKSKRWRPGERGGDQPR
jgi:hypothetical protein